MGDEVAFRVRQSHLVNLAYCPVRRQCFVASVRVRCDGLGYLPGGFQNPARSRQKVRRAACYQGRDVRQSPYRQVAQNGSKGSRVGSRHSRRCDFRSADVARRELNREAQLSGRRCISGHRLRRGRRSLWSGRRQDSVDRCRSGLQSGCLRGAAKRGRFHRENAMSPGA